MNEQELREAIAANNLAGEADRLIALIEPAIRFQSADDRGPNAEGPGVSQLGGAPDLPEALAWPEKDSRPLSFVAQVNLGELPPLAAECGLPGAGVLSFFYDAEEMAWGGPEDIGGWRVLFHEDPTALARREAPDGLDEEWRFPGRRLSPRTTLTLPSAEPDFLGDDEETCENYWALRDAIFEGQGDGLHQMLGRPCEIQDAMEFDCQAASAGLSYEDFTGHGDPKRKALEEEAKDWRLLLQIDSDDRAEMMWGDLGMLYFWIRKQDLAERRFDACWMVMQCS